MTALLGGSSPLSVVEAATAELPLYLRRQLPLIASLKACGMGADPAVALLITGPGRARAQSREARWSRATNAAASSRPVRRPNTGKPSERLRSAYGAQP
jgi:hypothetical protein